MAVTVRQHPATDYGSVVNDSAQLLDVRRPDDVAVGTFPGALNIPLVELPTRLSELDRSRRTVVCARAASAALRPQNFWGRSDSPTSSIFREERSRSTMHADLRASLGGLNSTQPVQTNEVVPTTGAFASGVDRCGGADSERTVVFGRRTGDSWDTAQPGVLLPILPWR